MAELSVSDVIMPTAQMRPLLKLAQEPGHLVPCAVGLDKAAEGVILLARNGSPKKVRQTLIATVTKHKLADQIKTDAQSILFGFASTDLGAEAILKLTLNREPARSELLASKLHRRVRTAGFAKVVFAVDLMLEQEREDGSDGAAPSVEAEASAAPADSKTEAATDAAALYRDRLASLTPALARALKEQIGDTGKMRAVAEFMREKAASGAFDAALKAMTMLEQLLQPPEAPAGADEFSVARFRELRDQWAISKEAVNRSLAALHAEIIDDFDDPESTTAADQLARILARFNEGLTTTLDAIGKATAGERGQLAAKAGRIAGMYLAYLQLDPLIAHVEDNPYEIQVAIQTTLSAPLAAIRDEVGKFATV